MTSKYGILVGDKLSKYSCFLYLNDTFLTVHLHMNLYGVQNGIPKYRFLFESLSLCVYTFIKDLVATSNNYCCLFSEIYFINFCHQTQSDTGICY